MANKITTTGRFYWHELSTDDLSAAKGFYGELFGWTTKTVEMGPGYSYTIIQAGGKDIGGLTKVGKSGPGWLSYVTATSVDDTTERAKKSGAKVIMPPTDIPTVGRFSVLEDKQGARFAPFRPESEEAEPKDRPGLGEFCWNELCTQDPKSAVALYTDAFELSADDKDMGPMGTYTVLKAGEAQRAGVMKCMDPKAPSFWLNYVAVSDVDQSHDKAKRLKATSVVAPADIPGIGRFAVVVDPNGASIALFKG